MFSKACEYSIRAMIFIAQRTKNGDRLGIREIAAGVDSPTHFMGKLLTELTRKGLLMSAKGPNGGFYIDDKGLKLTLADLVNAVDGNKLFTGCGLGLKACNEHKPCPIHDEFKIVRNKLKGLLETTRIGEFNDSLEKGLVFLKRS
jgi:Rrf2 family protein